MSQFPSITPEGPNFVVRPYGDLHPDRCRMVAHTRGEAEFFANRLALTMALKAHAYEGMVLTLCSELENAPDGLVAPVDLALKLRSLRERTNAEIEAEVEAWVKP